MIYNLEGRAVRTLLDTVMAPGSDKVRWDGHDDDGNAVEGGIYLIHMDARNQKLHFKKTRKYVLLK